MTCAHLLVSDYKPELQRLAKERDDKAEADKKSNLERAMRDMNVGDRSGPSGSSRKGRGDNPFGPYPMNERQDRYDDYEGERDSEEEEDIRRQIEEEEEAENADDLGAGDMGEF